MACDVTVGLGRPDCPGETPGARDTIYLFNRDRVSAFVAGAGNIVDDITFTSGQGFFQYTGRKGSVEARAEKQDNETGATDYTHEIDIHFTDLSTEARDAIQDLNGATLGAIVRTKGDRFILYGYNEGLEMKVNNMSTGADALGYFVTLREVQVNELPRIFFDTNATATQSAIDAKVIAS